MSSDQGKAWVPHMMCCFNTVCFCGVCLTPRSAVYCGTGFQLLCHWVVERFVAVQLTPETSFMCGNHHIWSPFQAQQNTCVCCSPILGMRKNFHVAKMMPL